MKILNKLFFLLLTQTNHAVMFLAFKLNQMKMTRLNVSFNAGYYATKDPAVKWRKYPSCGAGRPKARDILQESGPSNYVPTSIAFHLTLLIELVHKVLEFRYQHYQHFCQRYPQSSAVNWFHGYQPFTIDEIFSFIGLQFISGAKKMGSLLLPDLF